MFQGFDGQMYFVKKDVLNQNAVKLSMFLSEDIDRLNYNVQSSSNVSLEY